MWPRVAALCLPFSSRAAPRPHVAEYHARLVRALLLKSWPVLKAVLAVAILATIGRQVIGDLTRPELWERPLHFGWLAVSAVLYVLAFGFSAVYWYRLLLILGQHPSFPDTVRAYYIGQMGKYVPGKAWALFIRSNLVSGPGTQVGVAVLSSLYEVLVTMSSGALIAAIVFGLRAMESSSPADAYGFRRIRQVLAGGEAAGDPCVLAVCALVSVLVVAIPTVPSVFNRLVHGLMRPFRQASSGRMPTPGGGSTLEGLALTSGCWLLLGVSLWGALKAVGIGPLWGWETWWRYTAVLALAYVSGFIVLLVPSGLGVREALLVLGLIPDISQRLNLGVESARSLATLTVILLRLAWTAAELVIAATLYWLPVTMPQKQTHHGRAGDTVS